MGVCLLFNHSLEHIYVMSVHCHCLGECGELEAVLWVKLFDLSKAAGFCGLEPGCISGLSFNCDLHKASCVINSLPLFLHICSTLLVPKDVA